MALEALCTRCDEAFNPADEDDLEHLADANGEPCGGTGILVGEWHPAGDLSGQARRATSNHMAPIGRPYCHQFDVDNPPTGDAVCRVCGGDTDHPADADADAGVDTHMAYCNVLPDHAAHQCPDDGDGGYGAGGIRPGVSAL